MAVGKESQLGEKLVTGHRVVVREKTTAGKAFQIGTMNDIQGDCVIGDYVRCQSNVFIGKASKVGNFVWLLPYTVLTNDPAKRKLLKQARTNFEKEWKAAGNWTLLAVPQGSEHSSAR